MLEIEALHVAYGGLPALRGVSLRAEPGRFVVIVGPNGAGKTTLFRSISGTVVPRAGHIRFDGRDLVGIAPAARPHLGIAHVPEGRQVFPSLTVRENLEMGATTAAGRRNWHASLARVEAWFPILAERRGQQAGTLSGGEQQMLAIGRGLVSAPRLLMLDEPSMGLSPAIADFIFARLAEIHRETGLTLLLVEQRVVKALRLADHGYVLEAGRIVLEGKHDVLLGDDRVRQAYLGM
jgi:branched-chain amino acid transport system ATP-binding protein